VTTHNGARRWYHLDLTPELVVELVGALQDRFEHLAGADHHFTWAYLTVREQLLAQGADALVDDDELWATIRAGEGRG
jgi:hypothetical protein